MSALNAADLFKNDKQRWAGRIRQWLVMKQCQATDGKNQFNQAEMIAIRVRIHEYRMMMGCSCKPSKDTGGRTRTSAVNVSKPFWE